MADEVHRLEAYGQAIRKLRLSCCEFGVKAGGEKGIRTPEPLQASCFQDKRDRPLRHLSTHYDTRFSFRSSIAEVIKERSVIHSGISC